MIEQEAFEKLGWHYELDEGFFGKLRHAVFDEALYQDVYRLLLDWPTDDSESISKDVVSRLWFIPVFMERQKKVVCENYPEDNYFKHQEELIDAIADILGYP